MIRRPAVLLLVLTAAVAAGCGGCGGGDKPDTQKAESGAKLFASVGCSSCHTLAAAGAHGQVGPDLDQLKPSEATVERQVTKGGGGMPAFAETLDPAQIRAVARYVAGVAGR
jgi:mono/diheme cytochrome c family protein